MTDESDAQRKLRESQQRLELALEGTGDGLFDYDFRTDRVEGNARLFTMLGYEPGELATMAQWADITHPDDLPLAKKAIADHVRSRSPLYRCEIRLRAKSGEWLWILDRGKVVERDERGHAVRMTGLHSDITERKSLELQLHIASRMAAVGTLAAGLAHELNTPLSTLTYGLEVVGRGVNPNDREALEALSLVKDATGRMNEIVRDVRQLSRADDAESRERTDVLEVLRRALRLTRPQLAARGRVSEKLAPVPDVIANPSRLGRVVMNLLMNAAQALCNNSPDNEIELASFTDAEGRVVVTVRDNGVGIPPESVARVFDPFFTTKAGGEGTGLGLSISQQIVTELSGTLTFETAVGRGTTFRMTLPAAPKVSERSRNKRLLIIDDNPGVGLTLKLLFKNVHQVEACTTAADALKRLLSEEQFDVVLCDLVMPVTNGMELFRAVDQKRPDIARRFVFMTGGAPDKELHAFLTATKNRVLEKPVPPDVLSGLLEQLP